MPFRHSINRHYTKGMESDEDPDRELLGISHVDGINTYVEHLKTGLERQGHQVDFLCPTPDESGFGIYPHNRVLEKEKFFLYLRAVQPILR